MGKLFRDEKGYSAVSQFCEIGYKWTVFLSGTLKLKRADSRSEWQKGGSAWVAGSLAWLYWRLWGAQSRNRENLGGQTSTASAGWHGLGRDCEVGVSKQNFWEALLWLGAEEMKSSFIEDIMQKVCVLMIWHSGEGKIAHGGRSGMEEGGRLGRTEMVPRCGGRGKALRSQDTPWFRRGEGEHGYQWRQLGKTKKDNWVDLVVRIKADSCLVAFVCCCCF